MPRFPKTRYLTRIAIVLGAIVVVALSGTRAIRYAHGLSFVVRAASLHGTIGRLAERDTVHETERLVQLRLQHEHVTARVYMPVRHPRQTVLLVSGLHPAGIDEPRLVAFARELARTRVAVVTPDMPELRQFEIAPALTDRVEQAAVSVATDESLASTGRIGLMGISFSGGLAIVAAGRPRLRDHLSYVFALGGHDDLPRVLRYLSTGVEPAPPGATARSRDGLGIRRAPHEYGLAIVLFIVADRLVPIAQVEPLRDGVRRFLRASYLDRTAAKQEHAAIGELASRLPPPAGALLASLNDRDVAALGPTLLPHLESLPDVPALSPSRSPAPTVPVFLLHGSSDTVIPPAESAFLAERLRGRARVRLLVTDLISHAEAGERAHATDLLRLAGFWGDLLAQ